MNCSKKGTRSADRIEAIRGRSGGQSQLIFRVVEAGLILEVVGNAYKQTIYVYTERKCQAIRLLIAMMGGRKSGRVREYKTAITNPPAGGIR